MPEGPGVLYIVLAAQMAREWTPPCSVARDTVEEQIAARSGSR